MRPLLIMAMTSLAAMATASVPPPVAPQPAFAAILAGRPLAAGTAAWVAPTPDDTWRAIVASGRGPRQAARWDHARALIAAGRAAEAIGVLDVMAQDEPALAGVAAYRLVRAAAAVQLRRAPDALEQLDDPGLAANPEACAWRLRALTEAGRFADALNQLDCARGAIAARSAPARRDFILAASRAAVAAGQHAQALAWLRPLAPHDPAANLERGRALLALGRVAGGERALASAARLGGPGERQDAALTRVETAVARNVAHPRAALREAERIRFVWRGDAIERRALMLSYRLSSQRGDLRAALAAGSALLNHFDAGTGGSEVVTGLQRQLAATLDPGNGLPLDQAAGLYWDYRDLAPVGAEGDFLVARLAQRLQEAGLYAKAAELLEHQLTARAHNLAKGPLSARVAALHILAGHPERALKALRASERADYPAAMRWERQRVAAVALVHLERDEEALRLLSAVPGAAALRGEIHWRRREWDLIARHTRAALPRTGRLGEGDQAVVLRHAIALGMLGRDAALGQLRSRYAGAFAGLASAPAFDVLTAPIGSVDPAAVGAAMAAIPAASPAGAMGDLLDAAPAT